MARNRAKKFIALADNNPRKKVVIEKLESLTSDGYQIIKAAESRMAFDKLMSYLTIDQRKLMYMRYQGGYSIRETAEFLGITEEAVKDRTKRIKEKLKKIVNNRGILP